MFLQRALSAAIGLPILFGLVYLDGYRWALGLPLLAVVVAVSMFGADEYLRMLRRRGFRPPEEMGKMMGALPPLFLYFYHYDYSNIVLLLLTLIIVVDVLMLALALIGDVSRRMSKQVKQAGSTASDKKRPPKAQAEEPPPGGTLGALRDFLLMAAGAMYVGGLMSYLILLRRIDESVIPPWGMWPVALLIAAVWIADTAAFGAGKLLDGPKLWPRLSPGKTVIGTVAGVAACAAVFAVAAAAGVFGGAFSLTAAGAVGMGAVVGAADLGGDLAESAVKRWAGVKDSGDILPGHGGVLDRFDSLLWAAPAFLYLLTALRG